MEYVHGGDIYTHKGMTDFSVNLNPFGPGRERGLRLGWVSQSEQA